MESKRAQRVEGLVLEEISNILQREIKDPRIGFATITKVTVSDDLRHAKVFVSIMGNEKEKRNSLKGLHSATGFIRRELGHRVHLRYVPELVFKLDDSMEKSARILNLLSELKRSNNK
tara:strand:+ start:773 stop:1126 length:354 start_codon:yes stop_codon:yes gene_type:complete